MEIIPAIDLKEGRCVRLKQGNFSDKTEYSDDPVAMALYFQQMGARRLHVVDLDGAQSGHAKNKQTIISILEKIDILLQLGGGIRSLENIRFWLNAGVDRVIVGTFAIQTPDAFRKALHLFDPNRLILAVDAKNGKVVTRGWQEESERYVVEVSLEFKEHGLQRILYTDILRDGMLTGPDLTLTKKIAVQTKLKVIASGGVSSQKSLDELAKIEQYGVDSVVIGKAFYEKQLNAKEVFEMTFRKNA